MTAGPPPRMSPAARRVALVATSVGMIAAGGLARVAVGPAGGWWGTFPAGPVLVLLAVCTATDLRRHRIYNWATYPGLLWGLTAAAAAGADAPSDDPRGLGVVGLGDAAGGAAVGFALMLVAYSVSGRRGAGDVKLATALGAWLGVRMALSVVVHTYAVAGVAVVGWLMVRAGPVRVLGYLGRGAGSMLLPRLVRPPAADSLPQVRAAVPMAPFFLAGTLTAVSRVFG